MKHLAQDVLKLRSSCDSLGITVEDDLLNELLEYLDALLLANESINLTRITDRESAIRLHVLDSLAALPEVLAAPQGMLCDIGTGGGFPGLPLAIAGKRRARLLDSVGKKALAVDTLLKKSAFADQVRAMPARAEQHAREFPGAYSVVTARAVGPLSALVELAAPLLAQSGVLVALKGAPTPEELSAGDRTAKVVGLVRRSTRQFELPGGDEQRCVVVYERVRGSKVALPRREGLAQHSPLG